MKSAIVNIIAVVTTTVLSRSDKSKVRTIVGAGLPLSVSVTRADFETLYKKAVDMPKVMNEYVHVRVSRCKSHDGFAIIENDVTVIDTDVADEAVEESVISDVDDFFNEMMGAINSESEQEVVETASPIVAQEPKKLSAIEQALADMQNDTGAKLAPVIAPVAIIENKTEETTPITEMARVISNSIHGIDTDLDFVTFVYNKAVAGKYPKWTQNITVDNVKEYAKLKELNIRDIIGKYLVAHPGNKGGIAYYSLKAEFVIKYYSKVCYSSPDRRWYVVISNNVIELYSGDGKKNTLAKKVVANEDPEQYAKAINVIKGYTFRGGELKK